MQKLDLRPTLRSMIENIKETFLPKTEMQKKQLLARSMICRDS